MRPANQNKRILSLFACILFSMNAVALTINILVDDERSVFKSSAHKPDGHMFKYYPLLLDGKFVHTLAAGSAGATIEEVSFLVRGKQMELPWLHTRRFLNLITLGWQHAIKWNPPQCEDVFHGPIPSCSYIMAYLAFGLADFTSQFDASSSVKEERTMEAVVKTLVPGALVIIRNKDNQADNNAVIYLGDGLFLSWSSYYGKFYFQSARHLDEDLPGEVKIVLITDVEGSLSSPRNWIIPKAVHEELLKYLPALAPLDHNNLPSYIN